MTRRRWAPLAQSTVTLPDVATSGSTVGAVVTADHPAYAAFPSLVDGPELVALARVLERHTTTPDDCWFTIWEGYSGSARGIRGRPAVRVAGLPHFLFRGRVADLPDLAGYLATADMDDEMAAAVLSHGQEHVPTNWWPADRAWLAGWHIDAAYVVIGGSPELVEELLAHPDLEVARTSPDAELVWG